MSLVGKPVYHIHDATQIQFGNVIAEKEENSWKWLQIEWRGGKPTNVYNSPSKNISSNWFRIDTVTVFEPQETINAIEAL